jgi:hypothetical protein
MTYFSLQGWRKRTSALTQAELRGALDGQSKAEGTRQTHKFFLRHAESTLISVSPSLIAAFPHVPFQFPPLIIVSLKPIDIMIIVTKAIKIIYVLWHLCVREQGSI